MGGSGLPETDATQVGQNAGNGGDLDELKDLLFAPEREQLTELRERIGNPELRAADVAEVLPESLLARARRDPRLRQVLQPILEEAILASVRKDPRVLAEALFPIIGGAIRRAVASALQNMVESLNQIVETSLSLRSIRWRIEAARTGKSYGEIALLRSLLYRVEQVFLIHRKTGLLLQHVIADATVIRDPDMVSGMLTAIQDFVQDSFGVRDDVLDTMRVGEMSVLIHHGPQVILAGVVRGTPPPQLRTVFSSTLETIEKDFAAQLRSFDGDPAPIASSRDALGRCLLGQSPANRRTSLAPVYVFAALVVLAVAGWFAASLRDRMRWNSYIAALGREPGIAITHQEKDGNRYAIAGLRDPLARDPSELLPARGISRERIEYHWEPYISLSPRFAARRELSRLQAVIENQVVRFAPGRSEIVDHEMDLIESIATDFKSLQKTATAAGSWHRLEAIGHADERGPEAMNSRLGWDRANAVKSALAAQGVEADMISTRSAGTSEPVRAGQTERDRSMNRSASFRVLERVR